LVANPDLVLDIEGGGGAGTRIIVWHKKEGDNLNQKWKHEDGFIISQANGCVLDVKGASSDPGAELVIWEKKDDGNANKKIVLKHKKTMRVRKRKRELKRDRTHTRRELGVSSVFDALVLTIDRPNSYAKPNRRDDSCIQTRYRTRR